MATISGISYHTKSSHQNNEMELNIESTLKDILSQLAVINKRCDYLNTRVETINERPIFNTNYPARNSSPRIIDPRDRHNQSSYERVRSPASHPFHEPSSFVGQRDPEEYLDWEVGYGPLL